MAYTATTFFLSSFVLMEVCVTTAVERKKLILSDTSRNNFDEPKRMERSHKRRKEERKGTSRHLSALCPSANSSSTQSIIIGQVRIAANHQNKDRLYINQPTSFPKYIYIFPFCLFISSPVSCSCFFSYLISQPN